MSKAQEERISLIINWGAKLGFVALCFLSGVFFSEMRSDIRQLGADISTIKERLAKIEGSLQAVK